MTGVQTCALPISALVAEVSSGEGNQFWDVLVSGGLDRSAAEFVVVQVSPVQGLRVQVATIQVEGHRSPRVVRAKAFLADDFRRLSSHKTLNHTTLGIFL